MSARRVILPAALLAMAVSPVFAQDPPEPREAAPAPRAVERVARPRDDGGAVRGARSPERVAPPESRQRARAEAPAPPAAASAPAASAPAPAFEEQQGGRRRPSSGGGGGRTSGGDGGRASSGGSRGDDGAVRRGGVRNPDNGGRADRVGQAVPRGSVPRPPQSNWRNHGRRYYAGPGLGYYYYDPFSWYGWGWPAYGAYGGWSAWNGYYGNNWGGYYGGGYGANYGSYGGPYGWSVGGVRLKVEERDAEVYVDGYYAGIIDDFDGIWQQLRLDDGGYRIEIRKTGFETLVFDVRVQPGRTITYRGRMDRMP